MKVDFHGSPDQQKEIDKFKDPKPYKDKLETEQAQQLTQAIDILWQLQKMNYRDATNVGYEKVRDAKIYLDKLLKQEFESKEEKTE